MTDTEQPSQWVVKEIETVTGDFLAESGAPFYRIEIDGYCADFDYRDAAENFASAIQRAFAAREAELVGENAKLREANMRLRNGYADAVGGLNYIIETHGRLPGVGFDRVLDHFAEWVTIPEREGLQAGSHTLAALKSREADHG